MAANGASGGETAMSFFTAGLQPPMVKPSELLAAGPAAVEPMVVYTGPKKTGPALIAAIASDAEKQATRRGKKSRVAAKKPAAVAEAKSEAKPEPKAAAKPAVRHAAAKPEAAKPAAAASTAPAAPKPAKPKAAAKPKTEAKPAG
jgi:D-alanyl-D-alanine carboxypeptidase